MQYKTIVLSLLEQRQQLHSLLRKQGLLMPAMVAYARELKHRHEAWNERLATARPEASALCTASRAWGLRGSAG